MKFKEKISINVKQLLNRFYPKSHSIYANAGYNPYVEVEKDEIIKYLDLRDKKEERQKYIEELKKKYMSLRVKQADLYQEHCAPDIRNSILWFLIARSYELNRELFEAETTTDKIVDLGSDFIITFPWNKSRIKNARENIYEFKEDKNNHKVTYLKGINIFVVTNGFHSTARGIELSNGSINCEAELPIEQVLKDLKIDFKRRIYKYRNEVMYYDFDILSIIIDDYKNNTKNKFNDSNVMP